MPYSGQMGVIQQLSEEVGAEERTLRRAVAEGTVRCRRPGPRRLYLEPGERDYLRRHWAMLSELRSALRTKPKARLVVLYGSLARGDADEGSDLDLAVMLADDSPAARRELRDYLEQVAGREVDVVTFDRAEADPLFLERIIEDGRVIVDRDGVWPRLRERRRSIKARARRVYERQMKEAARALEELTQ